MFIKKDNGTSRKDASFQSLKKTINKVLFASRCELANKSQTTLLANLIERPRGVFVYHVGEQGRVTQGEYGSLEGIVGMQFATFTF